METRCNSRSPRSDRPCPARPGAGIRACDMVRGTFSPLSEVPMGQRARRSLMILTSFAVAAVLATAGPASAQDKPRYGGELVFVGAAEPPSFDGHREETFGMLHPVGPHYNTLLRVDPTDKTGTKVIGDLAESWIVSTDKRTYTFKLRHGVKFHDASLMTSKDVKASYDKIIFPAPNVPSSRQEQYKAVEAVEAPNADTVIFRLKYPEGSFLASVASPWNFIYKADILAKDPRWYEKNIMGTGPFKFVEYVRGSHWVGKKNPDYWDKGKPYLDGYRVVFIQDAAAQVAAIRGERAMIQFRGFTPQQRDTLVQALGNKITVQESPWNCSIQVALNQNRKPFDDKRVRRALSLALDRWNGSKALSRIALVKEVAGIQVPGTQRATPMPYEPVGVWLIDQWKQIGVNVKQVFLETAAWIMAQKAGDFEVSTNAPCNSIVEPDMDLHWFITTSPVNYSKHKDTVMDDLYMKQSRATDPEERKKILRAFEKRLYDEEVHYIHTLQWHRIVPYNSKVHGYTVTPSHFLNCQLDTVWLAE